MSRRKGVCNVAPSPTPPPQMQSALRVQPESGARRSIAHYFMRDTCTRMNAVLDTCHINRADYEVRRQLEMIRKKLWTLELHIESMLVMHGTTTVHRYDEIIKRTLFSGCTSHPLVPEATSTVAAADTSTIMTPKDLDGGGGNGKEDDESASGGRSDDDGGGGDDVNIGTALTVVDDNDRRVLSSISDGEAGGGNSVSRMEEESIKRAIHYVQLLGGKAPLEFADGHGRRSGKIYDSGGKASKE